MKTSKNFRLNLLDTDEEILTMARWAKTLYDKNNSVRVGCVVPNLDKIRNRVLYIFNEIFGQPVFNISAGKPLLQCSLVNTALQLLDLHKKSIPLELFSSLLLSPFLGYGESEHLRRAYLDGLLRKENTTIINFPSDLVSKHCPRLAKKINDFLLRLEQISNTQTYSQWAKIFCELLALLGWPGERSLNSEEYQIVEHWLRLLEEFSTLDHVANPITFNQAMHTLKKMAAKSIFQPKTPDAPIQILGVLEAAGLPFNYLWIAGMDDLTWPPPAKPNPFIPKRLQREFNMPHATAERELIYCQQLMKQFQESAQEIIYSHARINDDLELSPSPLIKEITEITIDDLDLPYYQSPLERIFSSKKLEILIDEVAPILQDNEIIRGGVNILKQQALCPFKAFAEMRLHANELESPLPGLRAKDRGSVLHKALELLWNNLQDHETLCNQNESSLTELINSCIQEALGLISNAHKDKKQYLLLEKKRLFKLLWDWLQLEKQRSPFKVLNNEKSTQVIFKNLQLNVRIDRIDELEDGKRLVIDYKTSKNNDINTWFGDRPEEPQLPLYSLLDPDNTIGITFAQIIPGKICFKGVSCYSINIHGIKTPAEYKNSNGLNWENQLIAWKETFSKLSNDFYQGVAQVDPKDPQVCEWCSLKPFCRINQEVQYEN